MILYLRSYGGHGHSDVPVPLQKINIGKREIVGYGVNGEANYIDTVMAPFPAIRLVISVVPSDPARVPHT